MTDTQTAQTAKGAVHLLGSDFVQTVKNAGTPVLVDFFAEWCGPCKLAAPIIDKLADEFRGRAVIAKIDVDAEESLAVAREYQVQSIPTVIMFQYKDDKVVEVERKIGFAGEQGYRQMLDKVVSTKAVA